MAQLKSLSIGGNLVEDFVVEQSSADGWVYRHWNSGIAELWTQDSIELKTPSIGSEETALGASEIYEIKIPSGLLTSVHVVNVNFSDTWCWVGDANASTSALYFKIFRTTPFTESGVYRTVYAYIEGRWK